MRSSTLFLAVFGALALAPSALTAQRPVRLACSLADPIGAGTAPDAGQSLPEADAAPRLVRSCDDPDASTTRPNNGDAGFVIGAALAAGGIGVGFRWTRSVVPIAPYQTVLDESHLVGAKNSTLAVTLEIAARVR